MARTFLILVSCRIRLSCVCRRPAVSTNRTSTPRAIAASAASNATAAGSAPCAPFTRSTPRRRDHVSSCATAPARNVSAAANNTLRPSSFRLLAILATLVVLPAPLIPTTSTTVGFEAATAISREPDAKRALRRVLRNSIASSPRGTRPERNSARNSAAISRAARTPTSAATNVRSMSSINSSLSVRP